MKMDLHDYMARVEDAVHTDLGRSIKVFAVLPKDQSDREGYWEQRFVTAFMRDNGENTVRPERFDYGTITVCIDSKGNHMCHDGWYDRTTHKQALADLMGRAGIVVGMG